VFAAPRVVVLFYAKQETLPFDLVLEFGADRSISILVK
jgi:hypothetical protein